MVPANELNPEPVVAGCLLVAQQHDGLVLMTHDDVGPTIVVEIPTAEPAPTVPFRKVGSALAGRINEPAPAVASGIAEQHGLLRSGAVRGWRTTWPLLITRSSQPSLST